MSFPTKEEINLNNYTKPLRKIKFDCSEFMKSKDLFKNGRRVSGIPSHLISPMDTSQFKKGDKINLEQFMKFCYIKPIHNWGKIRSVQNAFDVVADVYVDGKKALSSRSGIIELGNSVNSFIYVSKEFVDEGGKILANIYQRSYISEDDILEGGTKEVDFFRIDNTNNSISYPMSYIDDYSSLNDLKFIIKTPDNVYHLDVISELVHVDFVDDKGLSLDKIVYTSGDLDVTEFDNNNMIFTIDFDFPENSYIALINKRFYLGEVNDINSVSNRNTEYGTLEYNTKQLYTFDPLINDTLILSKNKIDLIQNPYHLKVFIGGYRLISGIHYTVLPNTNLNGFEGTSVVLHIPGLFNFSDEKLEILSSSNYRGINDRNYIFKVNSELKITDTQGIAAGDNVAGVIDLHRYFEKNKVNLDKNYLKPLDHEGVIVYSNGEMLYRDTDYIIHNNYQIEFIRVNYEDGRDNYIEVIVDLPAENDIYNISSVTDVPSKISSTSVTATTKGLNKNVVISKDLNDVEIQNMNKSKLLPYNDTSQTNNLHRDVVISHNSIVDEVVLELDGISVTAKELHSDFITVNTNSLSYKSKYTSDLREHLLDNDLFTVNGSELELVIYNKDSDTFTKSRYDDNYKEISAHSGKENNGTELSLREKMINIIGCNFNNNGTLERDIKSDGSSVKVDGSWQSISSDKIVNTSNIGKRNINLNKLKNDITNINNHVNIQLDKLKEKIINRFNNNNKNNVILNSTKIFKTANEVKDSHSYLLLYNDTGSDINTEFRYKADVIDFNNIGFEGGIQKDVILQKENITVKSGELSVVIPYIYNSSKGLYSRKSSANDDINVSFELDNTDLKIIIGR